MLLRSQSKLRRLDCVSIGKLAFAELQKMRWLEVLSTDVSEIFTGKLESLKEFRFDSNSDIEYILRSVAFPKLEKLILDTTTRCSLEIQDFVALSCSLPNLRYIEIDYVSKNFIPAIIEHCLSLKKLTMISKRLTASARFDLILI